MLAQLFLKWKKYQQAQAYLTSAEQVIGTFERFVNSNPENDVLFAHMKSPLKSPNAKANHAQVHNFIFTNISQWQYDLFRKYHANGFPYLATNFNASHSCANLDGGVFTKFGRDKIIQFETGQLAESRDEYARCRLQQRVL